MLLKLYGSGFADQRALSFVNLYKYGGGFDMAAALAAKILPFDLFETRRLVGACVGIVGLIATWRIGRHLGGPIAGLIALVLLAACPLYYGHMFINAKDAPFAAAMAVLLLGLVRAFEEYPRLSARTVALTGIGLGLVFGSRILAGIVAPYVFAALLLIAAGEARSTGVRQSGARVGEFIWRSASPGPRVPDHGLAVALVYSRTSQSGPRCGIFRQVFRKAVARALCRQNNFRHRHAGRLLASPVRAEAS